MDYKRVSEIIKSPEMVEVLYEGNPVFIKSLQRNGVTANVILKDQPMDNIVPVPLIYLQEGNSKD